MAEKQQQQRRQYDATDGKEGFVSFEASMKFERKEMEGRFYEG